MPRALARGVVGADGGLEAIGGLAHLEVSQGFWFQAFSRAFLIEAVQLAVRLPP
jgi:hypothetical protein